MRKITKKYSNSQLIQIGFLLIIFGLFVCCYQFFYKNKLEVFDKMGQKLFFEKEKDEIKIEEIEEVPNVEKKDYVDEKEDTVVTQNKTTVTPQYQYIGVLEIPKINLKRGFVSPDSISNNVEENITILKPISMPNVEKGNFILAAHSGTGAIAYFNNLYQLQVHDKIYVYYKNKKYTYKIEKIYKQPKNGTIKVYRDTSKSTITLITCTNNDDTKQTVYVANQISIE